VRIPGPLVKARQRGAVSRIGRVLALALGQGRLTYTQWCDGSQPGNDDSTHRIVSDQRLIISSDGKIGKRYSTQCLHLVSLSKLTK
jgi:hypothetical protein